MIRRIFNLITLLFLLSFVVGVKAQQKLTVYSGTDYKTCVPVNISAGVYKCLKSQYVIPAADLFSMVNGSIYCITYHARVTNSKNLPYTTAKDVGIYIKEVGYDKVSEFETLTDDDLICKGKLTVEKVDDSNGLLMITLDKPYVYKGGNLLIASETSEAVGSKVISFYGKTTTNNTNVCGQADKIEKVETTLGKFIPETTFLYYAAPTVTGVATTPATATLSWKGDTEKYNLRYTPVYFLDDFENGIDNWTVIRNGEGVDNSDWRLMGTTQGVYQMYPHSGSYSIRCRSYADNKAYNVDNWIISPKVKLDGTLKYWVKDDGQYHEHYDVYVSTTNTELGSFTKFASPGDATSEWTEVSIDLSSYAGQEGYIAFRNTDYDQNYLLIDDIGIYPTNATWTEVADVTSPYTLNGLNEDTNYYFQVNSTILDEYNTPWCGKAFFTNGNPIPVDVTVDKTTAYTASLSWKGYGESYDVQYRTSANRIIFYDGFETGLDAWDRVNCEDNTNINGNAAARHSGNVGFAFRYTTNPPQYLVSKEISDIKDGSKLLFYYKNYHTGYKESFQVGYSSTTNAVDAFVFGDTISIQNNNWTVFNEDVPNGTKYICIKCTSDDKHHLFIDDITLFKPMVEGEWNTITDIDNPSVTITGLSADIPYDFQIRSKKGDRITEWTDVVEFTTAKEQVLSNLFAGENEWATYVSALDMALPEGLTAYTVSSLGATTANAESVDYLPKDVPVLLKRADTAVNTYVTDVCTGTEPTNNNLLKVADTNNQPMARYDYVLYNDEFVLVIDGTLADGKVYLSVPKNLKSRAGTRTIVTGGGDDNDGTTGIEQAPTLSEDEGAWFDLSGRKIAAPTRKGIYIKNGKKVVVL